MIATIQQPSLFDLVSPRFKNPLKRKRKEKKTIPKKDSFYAGLYNIKVEKNGLILKWIDEEGEYSVGFENETEAWSNYQYWCRSARRGGKL